MKIERIETHIVNLPLAAPYHWAPGLYPGATKTIVEVLTDDGLAGLGEVHGAAAARTIQSELSDRLIGVDPLDRNDCHARAMPPLETIRNTDAASTITNAYGGIEIALWDIAGKAQGRPLYQLLGGAHRREIAFSEYFSARPRTGAAGGELKASEVAAYCARMVEKHDSPVFEGKVGYFDPNADIALVKEVRAAIGRDRALRLDANMGWDLQTARWIAVQLGDCNIVNIEDPVGSFYDMARLRQHTPIAFSSHVPDLRTAVELGVPDNFVINLTALGGIAPTIAFIQACALVGHNAWFYSGDSGIGTAGYLHVSAAVPELKYAHQSLMRWQVDDVIVGGQFQPQRGLVTVPEGAGLGVELDREALARGERRFEEHGAVDPFGLGVDHRYHQLPLVWQVMGGNPK